MDGTDYDCEEETGLNLWHAEDESGNVHPIPWEDFTDRPARDSSTEYLLPGQSLPTTKRTSLFSRTDHQYM